MKNEIGEMGTEEYDALVSTSGHKKVEQFFAYIEATSQFQNGVKSLRKECGIPTQGFALKSGELLDLGNETEIGKVLWKTPVTKLSDNFCKSLGLDLSWRMAVQYYLLFNTFGFSYGSLFFVSDVGEGHANLPVMLRISQYASLNDILNYVRKMYKTSIEPIQKKYQNPNIRLGKIRKKKSSIQARNKLICENQHLPRKKIMKLVTDAGFESIDYAHIAKIISLETKKRENM